MIRPVRLVRELVPGVWGDNRGSYHVDVPKCLHVRGIEDSPRRRRRWALIAIAELRIALPDVVIIAHVEGLPQ